MNITRETQLVETFVTLADTLVDDYDVVELLQTLVERSAAIFDAAAAGIVLVDETGHLDVLASTDEDTRLVEVMQLKADQGPCIESYRTGLVVSVADITAVEERWPAFAARTAELGFRSVHSVPMRLRETTIGSLNLFGARIGELSPENAAAARALADVATIGILHERAVRESDLTTMQLQHALDSRVIIEQAKGVVAYMHDIGVDASFALIRNHARNTSTPLTEVARRIVQRELTL